MTVFEHLLYLLVFLGLGGMMAQHQQPLTDLPSNVQIEENHRSEMHPLDAVMVLKRFAGDSMLSQDNWNPKTAD